MRLIGRNISGRKMKLMQYTLSLIDSANDVACLIETSLSVQAPCYQIQMQVPNQ